MREAVVAARPDAVINCAAWTDVDGAETMEPDAQAVNGTGAGHVAAAAQAAGAFVVHVSTDYVFAGDKRTPYLESDAVAPAGAYGRTKLAGERAVAQAAPDQHTIVRTAWLFGAAGRCFPETILRVARERGELKVVDDQVGSPTYTGHLAPALVELAGGALPGRRPCRRRGRVLLVRVRRRDRGRRRRGLSGRALYDRRLSPSRPAPRLQRAAHRAGRRRPDGCRTGATAWRHT